MQIYTCGEGTRLLQLLSPVQPITAFDFPQYKKGRHMIGPFVTIRVGYGNCTDQNYSCGDMRSADASNISSRI